MTQEEQKRKREAKKNFRFGIVLWWGERVFVLYEDPTTWDFRNRMMRGGGFFLV